MYRVGRKRQAKGEKRKLGIFRIKMWKIQNCSIGDLCVVFRGWRTMKCHFIYFSDSYFYEKFLIFFYVYTGIKGLLENLKR